MNGCESAKVSDVHQMESNMAKADPKQLIVSYFVLLAISLLLFASPWFLLLIHALLLCLGIAVQRQTISWMKQLAWPMILIAVGLVVYDAVVLIRG